MVAFAIYASLPLAALALIGTVWALVRPKIRLPTLSLNLRAEHKARHFTMTSQAQRVRYTSTEMDIKDWDVVRSSDRKMVVHHVSVIMGMTFMVVVILVSGETAGAIATGALASHDGIALIQELLNR